MSIAALLEPITGQNGSISLPTAQNWMQGRTLFGGASALIAYTAAIRAFPQLPPLRAGQISFVAPVGEHIEVSAKIMREGRNVTQLRSEIHCEGKLSLSALWLFGTARTPNALHPAAAAQPWPMAPEEAEPLPSDRGPSFLRENFEGRRAQETVGPGDPVVRRWLRLKDRHSIDAVSSMILMGDTLPPGALRTTQRPGPFSSINWSLNLLDPCPSTQDGWWLGETRTEHADQGYSSERLSLWNTDGRQVLGGYQSVAIFG